MSLSLPSVAAARRIATTAACACGSPSFAVRLPVCAITVPARTITQPTGTSPAAAAMRACVSARSMKEGMSAARYGSSVWPELAIPAPMAERGDGGERSEQRDHHGRGERIAKVIARAGLASRREAERWISEGRVRVNAQVIASPAVTVTAEDVVAVDGKALARRERR